MDYSAGSSSASSNLEILEKAAEPAPLQRIRSNLSRLSKVSIRSRVHHVTWNWFSCTMATGGLALLISEQPHTFRGLITLGEIVFIVDLILFSIFSVRLN